MDDDDLEEADTLGRMGVGAWPEEGTSDTPTVTPAGVRQDVVQEEKEGMASGER